MPSFRAIRPVRIAIPSELDLNVDASGQIELHQRVDGLRCRVDNVEHAFVGADLELLARFLVDVRRAQDGEFLDFGRERDWTPHPRPGSLGRVDDFAGGLVEHAVIVGPQPNANVLVVSRHFFPILSPRARSSVRRYFMILATTPAPTVRPPSRIAKRSPSSIAIGAINSISIEMLSPGITISVPSGRCTVPVTSVVRK